MLARFHMLGYLKSFTRVPFPFLVFILFTHILLEHTHCLKHKTIVIKTIRSPQKRYGCLYQLARYKEFWRHLICLFAVYVYIILSGYHTYKYMPIIGKRATWLTFVQHLCIKMTPVAAERLAKSSRIDAFLCAAAISAYQRGERWQTAVSKLGCFSCKLKNIVRVFECTWYKLVLIRSRIDSYGHMVIWW